MDCNYCGNAYLSDGLPSCAGCGSPKTASRTVGQMDTDQLYAEVGHAMITGEPDRSRALLEKIVGSQQTEPKKLWTERGAKIALCLGLLYFFPSALLVIAAMLIPFMITVYLPYLGLKAVFGWISGDTARR